MAIYGLSAAEQPDGPAPEVDDAPALFSRHYTSETRAALPAMRLFDHEPLRRAAEQAGLVGVTETPLERVKGWETSPGSDLPYALVGHRQ